MAILGTNPTPPDRHDFEKTFVVIEGDIHATFRGKEQVVRTGNTIHIPLNPPHPFQNRSDRPARMLCICSPAGQEDFFMKAGASVTSRTAAPPKFMTQLQTTCANLRLSGLMQTLDVRRARGSNIVVFARKSFLTKQSGIGRG
ncbi:MAG TPA: cupin domain-containing protein [Verrucomicrobiae bacterium]|nr:cupin domain-containing protein [Verrucomicrobiae bacterium]